jgi:hypothetical protein
MVQPEGLDKMKKSNYPIKTQTYNLPFCRIVPQPCMILYTQKFPKNNMKILIEDFSAKVGKEDQ